MGTPNGRAQVNAFFGNPANSEGILDEVWYHANIVTIPVPVAFGMVTSWDPTQKVHSIYIHRKLVPSLTLVLQQIWDHARILVKETHANLTTAQYDVMTAQLLANLGLNQFGGTFNFRPIRGLFASLSLHSYGAAIDIDPDHNALGVKQGRMPNWVVAIFNQNGWFWGGNFHGRKDWMHFQFATGC